MPDLAAESLTGSAQTRPVPIGRMREASPIHARVPQPAVSHTAQKSAA